MTTMLDRCPACGRYLNREDGYCDWEDPRYDTFIAAYCDKECSDTMRRKLGVPDDFDPCTEIWEGLEK